MKYVYTFLLSIVLCTVVVAQETIDIEFEGLTPHWVHTVADSTFVPVPGQPYWTKFSSLFPNIFERNESFIYFLTTSLNAPALLDNGFVLDKVNVNTGEKLWSCYSTQYVGREQDFYLHIDFDYFGNPEFLGIWRDSIGVAHPIHKKINNHNGEILSVKVVRDSLYGPDLPYRHYRGFMYEPDSLYYHAFLMGGDVGTLEKEEYVYGVEFRLYDKTLNRISTDWKLFDFDYLGPLSIDQPNYLLRLDKHTLVSLAYKDRYVSWDNKGLKMMWTDISDPYNIKTVRIRDYTDIVPGTKVSFLHQRFRTHNNTISLSHVYPEPNTTGWRGYVLWLDSVGNIKSFVPETRYGSHIYQLADMIYANNDFAYLIGYPSVRGTQGVDILRLESGADTIRYISSINSPKPGATFGSQINALYEDGYLVMGGFTRQTGQPEKTSTKFYCFKAEDLGITFNTTNVKDAVISTLPSVKSYPNPTTGNVLIQCEDCGKYRIYIFDTTGRMIESHLTDRVFHPVDLTAFPGGIYHARVVDEGGNPIGKNLKIVKLH